MTLEEAWSAHEAASRERGEADEGAWKPMRAYVADAMAGLYSDTVPPPQSIHAMFAAVTSRDEALAVCAHIDTCLRAGKNPRKDIVTDAPVCAPRVAELTADHARYLADVTAGDVWVASVPGEKGRARTVPLLVLRDPTAVHALHWAFTDRTTPNGTGYGLVLIEREGQLTIAANPGAKLDLSWLAGELAALERTRRLPALETAVREVDTVWPHEAGTIRPPPGGSVVPFGELYNAIAVRLLVKRPVTVKQRLGLLMTALLLALVGGTIVLFAYLRRS